MKLIQKPDGKYLEGDRNNGRDGNGPRSETETKIEGYRKNWVWAYRVQLRFGEVPCTLDLKS